jgi:hypothetical protein
VTAAELAERDWRIAMALVAVGVAGCVAVYLIRG